MTILEIKDKLCEVWEMLDKLQEQTYYQEMADFEGSWYLHEAIANIDNCISEIEERAESEFVVNEIECDLKSIIEDNDIYEGDACLIKHNAEGDNKVNFKFVYDNATEEMTLYTGLDESLICWEGKIKGTILNKLKENNII